MERSKAIAGAEGGMFGELFGALADKHSQLDVNLQRVNIRFPQTGMDVEVNGLVTLTVHMRDLTEDEKRASAAKNVSVMSKP